MAKFDYKTAYKELYQPKNTPSVIDVPNIKFIQIIGKGNPNEEGGEYKQAVELLYSLSYTIKMFKKSDNIPEDYFDYVVPPLEGLWWLDNSSDLDFTEKNNFRWISMIRQPEFITQALFERACLEVKEKKPYLHINSVKLVDFPEGLCVQCMHIGTYDDEPATLDKIKLYMQQNNLISDISISRRHHEIYLSDPRKVEITKMKTILRIPVKRM